MKPTRAQIRFLNECSTPIPETSEQASKLITAMLNNPTIPAQTTAPHQSPEADTWRACSTGNHQGLIVSDSTGENIAVAYDKKHAPLIASAPQLLALHDKHEAALINLHCALQSTAHMDRNDSRIAVITGKVVADLLAMAREARAAISQATP